MPSALPVGLLLLLLLFLATDAHGGHRAGLEALDRDLLFADLADPEGPVLDARHGVIDLLEQELLAVAQAEHHALRVLGRSEVDLVRKVVRVERRLLVERLARLLEQGALLLLEDLLEALQVLLIHPGAPAPLSCFRAAGHLSRPCRRESSRPKKEAEVYGHDRVESSHAWPIPSSTASSPDRALAGGEGGGGPAVAGLRRSPLRRAPARAAAEEEARLRGQRGAPGAVPAAAGVRVRDRATLRLFARGEGEGRP